MYIYMQAKECNSISDWRLSGTKKNEKQTNKKSQYMNRQFREYSKTCLGAEKMVQQLMHWLLIQKGQTGFPAPTWQLITIIAVPEDLKSSSSFRQKAHMWRTDIHVYKILICIKQI